MPIYHYKCHECGWEADIIRKMGDHVTRCPKCDTLISPRIGNVMRVWGKGGKPS